MPAMPAPSTGFPQPPAQSCSLALSVCPQSLPIASSRLLGALFQFSNFRHKPFFPASLLLLQLVTPCVWGGRGGGGPNPSQMSSPPGKTSPLSELPQCLACGTPWLPQVRRTARGASLPCPTGLHGSKVWMCRHHLSRPRVWPSSHRHGSSPPVLRPGDGVANKAENKTGTV